MNYGEDVIWLLQNKSANFQFDGASNSNFSDR